MLPWFGVGVVTAVGPLVVDVFDVDEDVLEVDVVDVVLEVDPTDDDDLDVVEVETVTVTPIVVVMVGVMEDETVVLTQT
jgi:hypothetical protein